MLMIRKMIALTVAALALSGCEMDKPASGTFVMAAEPREISYREAEGGVQQLNAEAAATFTPDVQEPAERAAGLPEGFAYVTDVAPDVILEIRYYSTFNFVGERIDGYNAPVSIMTAEAAEALRAASDALRGQGYAVKIYDSYRPEDAVAHFIRWGGSPDERMKPYFYPGLEKRDLFSGYISSRSGHSRGSTIDLTIVDMTTGTEADMGGPFDFLGPLSNHGTELITPEQAANRLILKTAMEAAGFRAYSKEWWHYTLENEPFPDTYFNFPVE